MKKLFANKYFNWSAWTGNVIAFLIGQPFGFGYFFLFFILWLIFAEKE